MCGVQANKVSHSSNSIPQPIARHKASTPDVPIGDALRRTEGNLLAVLLRQRNRIHSVLTVAAGAGLVTASLNDYRLDCNS